MAQSQSVQRLQSIEMITLPKWIALMTTVDRIRCVGSIDSMTDVNRVQ